MKLQVSPAVLLAALHIAPSTAFAPASHAAIRTSLASYNNFNHGNDCSNDYSNDQYDDGHPIYSEPNVDLSRRDTTGTFFRGLTAAGAVAAGGAAMTLRPWNANAAEFSDGFGGSSAKAVVGGQAPPPKTTPSIPKLKTPAASTSTSSTQYVNSLETMDSNVLAAGAVAAAGFFGYIASNGDSWDASSEAGNKEAKPFYQPPTPYGIINKDKNPYLETANAAAATPAPVAAATATSSPPPGMAPYGLAAGRNFWDNKPLPPKEAPSAAVAVKSYLDNMNIAPKPVDTGMATASYDTRLANIEHRVTSLERRVDQLPDQVMVRVEEWMNGNRAGGMANTSGGGSTGGAPYNVLASSPVPPKSPPPVRVVKKVFKSGRSGMGGYLESLR